VIIGLDMGGTHVDAVLIDHGKIIKTSKIPTEPNNLLESVWKTLKPLITGVKPDEIERVILSTTICTNAIVEEKTAHVGMIIESGPGLPCDFLACGQENIFTEGYIDHRGREVSPINSAEINRASNAFKNKNISACAVVGKFSVRNPDHEIKIYDMLKNDFSPVTLGHTVSGKLNFPRRVFTSYFNSAVYSTFSRFSNSIVYALKREKINAKLYVLKADGGTMGLESAEKFPVNTILSGPAASIMGGQAFFNTSKDGVFLDIGGTTTDIAFLADGVPLFEPLGIKIGEYPTLVRALYSVSMGLGGDSEVRVENGVLHIGPYRKGSPMALGGPCPTPTDAMIAQGLLDIGSKEKAVDAMKDIAGPLDLNIQEAASLVLQTMANMIKEKVDKLLFEINSHPVYTVKELLYGKKINPEFVQVIGGPAKILAPILEKSFKIPCFYPKFYEAANAVGAALAKTTAEITVFVDTAQGTLLVPEIGLYKKIERNYTLEDAKLLAVELLSKQLSILGAEAGEIQPEIVEENVFNIVRGFYTSGKNMRIRVQTKPGLLYEMWGDKDA